MSLLMDAIQMQALKFHSFLVFHSLLHNGVVSNQRMSQRCRRVLGSWSSTQCHGHTAPTFCFSLTTPSFKTPHLCFTVSIIPDACPVFVNNNFIQPCQVCIAQLLISYNDLSCLVNILHATFKWYKYT